MTKKITVLYWSPSIVNIATNKAVINSAYSLKKFNDKYQCAIFNFFGEFERFKKNIFEKKLNLVNFYNNKIFKLLPKHGKLGSRFSFILIFFLGFIPLYKKLKKDEPDFLIIHLLTSLPLILLIFFNFKTKFILRISGFPRLNFFRKIIWKLALKKIHIVTCPTVNTLEYLKKLNFTNQSKIKLLYDPVFSIKEININKKKKIYDYKNYYLSVGRLTHQKNFLFLCRAFKEITKINKELKLIIAGDGEDKKKLLKYIKKNKLESNILIIGYVHNIYPLFKNSKGFILSSLWEDPGFVLIEAAICKTPVLSSDVRPGPTEIIKNNINGILYKSNDLEEFVRKFHILDNEKTPKNLILNNLKTAKKFSLFDHYKNLNVILSIN